MSLRLILVRIKSKKGIRRFGTKLQAICIQLHAQQKDLRLFSPCSAEKIGGLEPKPVTKEIPAALKTGSLASDPPTHTFCNKF
ncbi:hypothetical protein PoB_003155200 [Plakobranchus ocellatus]|uniref:Uncharacterized protein n=1 Tax=Plakobranchus ocellatus TaxID=259542 RepID=A0AAV4ACP3_9GAST|nr:hypothetical protein PoB_003155200 [Plakobranchus ocellatus]